MKAVFVQLVHNIFQDSSSQNIRKRIASHGSVRLASLRVRTLYRRSASTGPVAIQRSRCRSLFQRAPTVLHDQCAAADYSRHHFHCLLLPLALLQRRPAGPPARWAALPLLCSWLVTPCVFYSPLFSFATFVSH